MKEEMATNSTKKTSGGDLINIEGVNYDVSKLSVEAKKLLMNVKVVQTEIAKHKARIEIAKTAQTVYLDLFKKEAQKS